MIELKVKVSTKIKVPMVPGFLRTDSDKVIPLADVSDEDLKKVGEQWTLKLLQQAKIQRERST